MMARLRVVHVTGKEETSQMTLGLTIRAQRALPDGSGLEQAGWCAHHIWSDAGWTDVEDWLEFCDEVVVEVLDDEDPKAER